MPICFLTNIFLLFLLTIYLDIICCVLKLGGKSSLLRLLTIIGLATVINTFGFIIVLIHIRRLFILGIMPVDLEQWCAEIGNFNGFSQFLVVKLYLNIHFICISETFFDSSVKNIQPNSYNLIRADHLSNTKRGGVCIFYKEALAVRIVNSLKFNECIVYEVSNKIVKVILVSYIGLQANELLNLKILFQILRKF